MDESVEFVPVRDFSSRIAAGWKMVSGYPLNPGDYAVLMVPPPDPEIERSNKVRSYASREATKKRRLLAARSA